MYSELIKTERENMMRVLIIISAFCLITISAQAEVSEVAQTPAAAEMAIKEIMTEDVITASQPLNDKIDYIAKNYSESDLKYLIKNYEKTNKKVAARRGKAYVPYDKKIDVNNPAKVKRYFRKRVDIIF